jgi:ribosomal-protein-alanine N-acetyltransferase
MPHVTIVRPEPPIVPRLRGMRTADLPAVLAIERAAYEPGWPATSFERELTHNQMARYLVLEAPAAGGSSRITGFCGLWLMVDQAHVVTVAVQPEDRGRGFGRLLVHGLVNLAIESAMTSATLEVRPSNVPARALYAACGFYEVGLRRRYYSDNQEDAVIMTTEEFASPAYQERLERLAAELAALIPGASPAVRD